MSAIARWRTRTDETNQTDGDVLGSWLGFFLNTHRAANHRGRTTADCLWRLGSCNLEMPTTLELMGEAGGREGGGVEDAVGGGGGGGWKLANTRKL